MQHYESVPSAGEPLDLIDLKFLPAWVKEDWSAPRHAEWEETRNPGLVVASSGVIIHLGARVANKNRDRRDRPSRDERRDAGPQR